MPLDYVKLYVDLTDDRDAIKQAIIAAQANLDVALAVWEAVNRKRAAIDSTIGRLEAFPEVAAMRAAKKPEEPSEVPTALP